MSGKNPQPGQRGQKVTVTFSSLRVAELADTISEKSGSHFLRQHP